MAIGFVPFNLDAAVAAVMRSAEEKGQGYMPQLGSKDVRLNDAAQVREYLKKEVAEAYAEVSQKPEGVQIARIEGVPYSPVGFVFERHAGEMHPPPERHNGDDGDSDIEHLGYFWSIL